MNDPFLERQKAHSEDKLKDKACDFTSRYFAVYDLQCLAESNPEIIGPETTLILQELLKDPGFSLQRRGFFLFRLAADTLACIITNSQERTMADQAYCALKNVLATTTGHAHRVSAEALGSLPFSIQGPGLKDVTTNNVPRLSWQQILDEKGLRISYPGAFFGRSLVAPLDQADRLLVLKLARPNDSPHSLFRETLWMEHLRQGGYSFPLRFNIPLPMKIENSYVFSLKDMPVALPGTLDLHPKRYAIGFIADRDYFTYANDYMKNRPPAGEGFKDIIFRNARLLGRLTSLGIVHSAPIPLFHNRVQRGRRRDHGLYEWFRAGRLDRWLDSCSYPNLGLTGIRDFEHFIAFKGPNRHLYRHIGSHILSLLLLAGSYFRNKNRARIGFDKHGKPVDARDLFDKPVLKEIIQGIFLNYYHGFVETEFRGDLPFNLDELACRMIDEMGVDRHMEEMLRVADQKEMTKEEFRSFLQERGYCDDEIDKLQKGIKDIVLHTGPHLGGFNESISLPELIESVGTMSALCIVGRYWRERF